MTVITASFSAVYFEDLNFSFANYIVASVAIRHGPLLTRPTSFPAGCS